MRRRDFLAGVAAALSIACVGISAEPEWIPWGRTSMQFAHECGDRWRVRSFGEEVGYATGVNVDCGEVVSVDTLNILRGKVDFGPQPNVRSVTFFGMFI